jgi:hypothetical protein
MLCIPPPSNPTPSPYSLLPFTIPLTRLVHNTEALQHKIRKASAYIYFNTEEGRKMGGGGHKKTMTSVSRTEVIQSLSSAH